MHRQRWIYQRANIIWGVAFDPELEDELRITLLATGFDKKPGDDSDEEEGTAAETRTFTASTPAKKEAPKKSFASGDFDLDDFFNDAFIK